jgi:Tol biopolymer transport system component
MVYQLDGLSGDSARTETVSTVDVGTGETRTVGSIPVTANTCCPMKVSWTNDRSRAFLYSLSLRGIVDVNAGTIARRPGGISPYSASASHAGDRVAWLDADTGNRVKVVITDLDGNELKRLPLPKGTWGWQERPEWSPDDRTLLVKSFLELRTAADARLAVFACCSTHGPSALHVYAVPVDGSPVRDLVDDATEEQANLADPPPSAPAILDLPDGLPVGGSLDGARWSPDGRSIAYTEGGWWQAQRGKSYRDWVSRCLCQAFVLDIASGRRTLLSGDLIGTAGIAWSPDGSRLLFAGTPLGGLSGLYVVDRDGGALTRLADTGYGDTSGGDAGSWSPDGTWIAFGRLHEGLPDGSDSIDAWVMRADGADARLVGEHAAAGW